METQLSNQGLCLNGRQVLWLIYQRYRVSRTASVNMTREHLYKIELKNDNLPQFINDWNELMTNIVEHIDEGTLAYHFRKQIDKSSLMKRFFEPI